MQERLLEAAITTLRSGEKEQISVRRITDAAGVNVAAVTTAFGGRSALLDALLFRVLIPVNEERIRRFDLLDEAAGLEEVLHAFVDPLIEVDAVAVSVLSAVVFDHGADRTPLERILDDPAIVRLSEEIRRRQVMSSEDLHERVRLAVGAILASFAMSSTTDISRPTSRESLVLFVAAGIRGRRS